MTSKVSMRSRAADIVLQNVSKTYGSEFSMRGIDLDIESGEFITLLGPSGSGKTTTLNLIAGYLEPDEGVLSIGGRSMRSVPPYKRDIGMVFQSYALFPHMSVRQNIEFPLKQRKHDKASRRALCQTALETVRLQGFENRLPAQLSGGQQQRVAFARAIVYSPAVLLMDEPLGALDKKLRDWLQLEIKRVHREVGSTFVYVTHDQEEALSLSDRVVVFNHGHIEQIGTPIELYERPATMFAARFVGESCILRGQVTSHPAGSALRFGDDVIVCSGRLPADGNAAVAFRPEHAVLGAAGDTAREGWALVPAVVEGSTYVGSRTRYQLRFADDSLGVASAPPGQEEFAPGEKVSLTWRCADAVIVPDDPSVDLTTT